MKIWYSSLLDPDRHMVEVARGEIRIGRSERNDIPLNSPLVPPEAIILQERNGSWELVCKALTGVQVGERVLYSGERCRVEPNQTIQLGPYCLELDLPSTAGPEDMHEALEREVTQLIRDIHGELLDRVHLKTDKDGSLEYDEESLLALEQTLDVISRSHDALDEDRPERADHIGGLCVRGELLADLIMRSGRSPSSVLQTEQRWSRLVSAVRQREDELASLTKYFADLLKLNEEEDLSEKVGRVDRGFWANWKTACGELRTDLKHYLVLRYLKKAIKDILFGLGPLEDLLRLPTITEIMVIDSDHIFVEKDGVVENSGRRFVSDKATVEIIRKIVHRVNRQIDRSSPLVDARLPDGSRVNAIIPPLAVDGPCLTIRKFPERRLLVDDLVDTGALTRAATEFLRAAVLAKRSILISGGTGTGKTTLLNCLSDFIPDKERIVTIEDTAELQLNKQHVVRLETKEGNREGAGEYSIRTLVKNALRMRPDRIIVGECRGSEALDMLQAMNTGHSGSLTTIHANTAADVIPRLEVLVQMAADLPVDSIDRQIGTAIDLIVQLHRMRNGRRCVSQIAEITAVDPLTGKVRMKDIFALDQSVGDTVELAPTGHLPTFMGELMERDLLNLEAFYSKRSRTLGSPEGAHHD